MSDNDELISPVGTKAPEFVITRASVNNEPVELDGKPMDAEEVKEAHKEASSPQEEERRQQLIEERKDDPAVLVDIPQTPRADELATSGAGTTADG